MGFRSFNCFSPKKKSTNRNLEDWQWLMLNYLKDTKTKKGTDTLKIPFDKLGFSSVTDFVRNIPPEMAAANKSTDGLDMKKIFKRSDRIVWTDSEGQKIKGEFVKYISKTGKAKIDLSDHNRKGERLTVSVKNLEYFKSFLKTFLPNMSETSDVTIIPHTSYQERPVDVGNDNRLSYHGETKNQDNVGNTNNVRQNLEPLKHSISTEVNIANIYGDPGNWKPGSKFINRERKVAIWIDSYWSSDSHIVRYQLVSEKKTGPQHYKECPSSAFFAEWYPLVDYIRPSTSNTNANSDNAMEVDPIACDDNTNIFEDSNVIASSSGKSDEYHVNVMETEIAGEPEMEEQERKNDSPHHTTLSPPVSTLQINSISSRKIRAGEKRHHRLNPHYSTPTSSMKTSSKSARQKREDEKQIMETIKKYCDESANIATHSNHLISGDNQVAATATTITSRKEYIATTTEDSNAKASKESSNLWMQRKNSQEGRAIEQSSPHIPNSRVNLFDNYDTRYPQQKQIEIPKEPKLDSHIFPKSTPESVYQQDAKIPKIKNHVTDISPHNARLKLAAINKKEQDRTNSSLRSPRAFTSSSPPSNYTSNHAPIHPSSRPPNHLSNLPPVHTSSIPTNHPSSPSSIYPSNYTSQPQIKITAKSNQMLKETRFSDNQNKYGNLNESKEKTKYDHFHNGEEIKEARKEDSYRYVDEVKETTKDDSYDNDINEIKERRKMDNYQNYSEEMKERKKNEFRHELTNINTNKRSPSSNNRREEKTIVMNDNYKYSIPILEATLEDKISIACGNQRGIQWSNNSCFMDASLFSFYYWSNIFDKITLFENKDDNDLARKVKRILKETIVTPLREDRFVSAEKVNRLRSLLAAFSNKMNGSFMDAEEFMFILFEKALKLKEFIQYTEDSKDFLHQIVLHQDDASSKCQTLENLFSYSLQASGDMKLLEMPNPALILVMPRSNGHLIRYEAIVPNLTLNIGSFGENGPKHCVCNDIGVLECTRCKLENGDKAIVYCDNCSYSAFPIHEGTHDPQLVLVEIPKNLMELTAVICIRDRHYTAFVRTGTTTPSKWLFLDSMYPQVQLAEQIGEMLELLAQKPKQYKAAIKQNHHIRRILTDSHVCIYRPMSIST